MLYKVQRIYWKALEEPRYCYQTIVNYVLMILDIIQEQHKEICLVQGHLKLIPDQI